MGKLDDSSEKTGKGIPIDYNIHVDMLYSDKDRSRYDRR